MTDHLRFGIFMAPFHPAGENPTLAMQRDLDLIQHLDVLGYDEAWIGEHHSAGSEIIASPEIFIATAAERTRNIKLGTGVVSVSYHNPYMVAERAVLLDHLTRGRFMLGMGPGALPTDAVMIGLDQSRTRQLLEDATDIIVQLLRSDDPVTFSNERWDLRDARLHLRPYSDIELAIAAVASPSGPRLAGKHGLGLLSIGATQAAGFDVLGLHWDVMEERAATFGSTVSRDAWRLVGMCHVAETKEQAYKDVEYGMAEWFDYFQHTAAFPQMDVGQAATIRDMIDTVIDGGLGAIGTADDVGAQIERLQKQSNGGFGAYLMMAHEWANPEATKRSFELISRRVMPEFQGQGYSTRNAKERARQARTALAEQSMAAVTMMTEKYAAEVAAKQSPNNA